MNSELQPRRRADRSRQRRTRIVRRRLAAVATLVVVVAVVAAVALGATGSGSSTSSPHASASADHGAHRHAAHRRPAAAGATAPERGESTAAALGPPTGRPGTASVPVLMYHVIAPPPAGAPFPGLYVLPQEFAAQMAALKHAGWHPVTLDQLRAYWTDGAKLPPGKPIVITFDNGYHSQYSAALPVLRRMGWVADENIQLSGLPPSQGGLTAPEVKALVDSGWELDTQGISHADLVTLDASELHYQIVTARHILQRRYGVPVNWFCYPSGHYDPAVIDEVRAAGYVGSTTVIPGWASRSQDPYRLPRLRVLGGTSPAALLAQIASAQSATTAPSSYGVT